MTSWPPPPCMCRSTKPGSNHAPPRSTPSGPVSPTPTMRAPSMVTEPARQHTVRRDHAGVGKNGHRRGASRLATKVIRSPRYQLVTHSTGRPDASRLCRPSTSIGAPVSAPSNSASRGDAGAVEMSSCAVAGTTPYSLCEHRVQRLLVAHVPAQLREPLRRQVRGLDRHRPVVGQAQPFDAPDRCVRRDVKAGGDGLVGLDAFEREQPGRRGEPVLRGLLGEAGQMQRPLRLRFGHVGARTLPTHQPSFGDELEQALGARWCARCPIRRRAHARSAPHYRVPARR